MLFRKGKPQDSRPEVSPEPIAAKATVRKAKTLDELLKMPADKLKDVDIAEMNLLCATGLPGAEKLNIDSALATLDQWADRVAFETKRHLYRVTDPRYADHYHRSDAYFRAEMLLQVLQTDLGVKFDMAAKDNFLFKDSCVAFIHGMIPISGQAVADTPGGTCASMPVMYVAVGRRLGYPLKLVTTNAHIFVRWDGKDHPNSAWRERFNIEGAGQGFGSFDDDYYKSWPFKVTDDQIRENGWLVSLSPSEELAEFLAARGHCATDNGQAAFAARCYENAYRYGLRPSYRSWFAEAARQSGYRPFTPELASLLVRPTRSIDARRPTFDTLPMPSAAAMPDFPGQPQASSVNSWQPQPITPMAAQPRSPQIPTRSPFSQQPAMPGRLPR